MYVLVSTQVCASMCGRSVHVWVCACFCTSRFSPLSIWVPGMEHSCQAWQQIPLPTGLSYQLSALILQGIVRKITLFIIVLLYTLTLLILAIRVQKPCKGHEFEEAGDLLTISSAAQHRLSYSGREPWTERPCTQTCAAQSAHSTEHLGAEVSPEEG